MCCCTAVFDAAAVLLLLAGVRHHRMAEFVAGSLNLIPVFLSLHPIAIIFRWYLRSPSVQLIKLGWQCIQ